MKKNLNCIPTYLEINDTTDIIKSAHIYSHTYRSMEKENPWPNMITKAMLLFRFFFIFPVIYCKILSAPVYRIIISLFIFYARDCVCKNYRIFFCTVLESHTIRQLALDYFCFKFRRHVRYFMVVSMKLWTIMLYFPAPLGRCF